MGEHRVDTRVTGERLRSCMTRVLSDLRALERMIAEGLIESGVRRVGAEQELFLVDEAWRPATAALELLEAIDDPHFTTELALFDLEANLDPLVFEGDCLARMERQLRALLAKAREAAGRLGVEIVLTGILPTLRKSDLGLEAMTPMPRYRALNEAMTRLRGGAYEFDIRGVDELLVRHDSVMLEACNTSFQVHFQVGADEFPNLYNVAQAVAGPVLAAATNSPLLFGRRLWRETRIALFQQAVDTRSSTEHLRERRPRVRFGERWVRESVTELYKEDVARFKLLLTAEDDEDPFEVLDRGGVPALKALRLHNGTVYRWNRACYGITDGKAHLRIENRYLPSGPTPQDEVASAAFWFGLVSELSHRHSDIAHVIEFEHALANFQAAARFGLGAEMTWLQGREARARDLVLDELLPLAEEGLRRKAIAEEDAKYYLGIVEERVRTKQTGSQWILTSLAGLPAEASAGEKLTALTAAMVRREKEGAPVARWSPARRDEAGGWKQSYMKVEQYMTTDLFTVDEDDPIDLVASLMDWEKIRHVPVEDREHRLVGLVSYRTLLRLLARGELGGDDPVPVSEVMKRNPVTVSPETSTLDAIALMSRHRIGCLPVVKDGRLVGIVTERDFMRIARELLLEKLAE